MFSGVAVFEFFGAFFLNASRSAIAVSFESSFSSVFSCLCSFLRTSTYLWSSFTAASSGVSYL